MKNFYRRLAVHLERGDPAFVAIVADHTRHSPGTRGAKMFVAPNGLQVGTIGGGIMEGKLREAAASLIAGGMLPDIEVLHHREDPEGSPSGLICAGKQTMVTFVARSRHLESLKRFADAVDDDEEEELVISSRGVEVRRSEGVSRPIELSQSDTGFEYVERALHHYRVAIVGGGHCGRALARVMSQLDYHVTWFDTRPDVFTFRDADLADKKQVVRDYADAASLVPHPELTHLVVMTADLPSDVRALIGARGIPFPYVGVMGSAAKLARIREQVLEAGVPEGEVDRWYAPVGLEMSSNTPEEIAISVAAQILREREGLFAWARPSAARSDPEH